MIDLVMRDLAAVHKVDVEQLWDEFEDYHAWDFYRDEFQLGKLTTFSHISLNHHPLQARFVNSAPTSSGTPTLISPNPLQRTNGSTLLGMQPAPSMGKPRNVLEGYVGLFSLT